MDQRNFHWSCANARNPCNNALRLMELSLNSRCRNWGLEIGVICWIKSWLVTQLDHQMGLSDSRTRTWGHKKGNLEITYSKLPNPLLLHILFWRSPIDRHLGCFYTCVFTNHAAVNILLGLLGHMVTFCSTFWHTVKLIPIAASLFLTFYLQYTKVPISSHSCQRL